ncbi:MAG: PilZ domain-containing protein [Methylohalobius sp.]|nr:PilZ domain-containing protein [Methylohalobius sp.]
MSERRKEPRVPVLIPLRVYDQGSGEILGELANLSRHGMMLLSHRLIEPGRVFQVEIPVPKDQSLGSTRLFLGIESLWFEPDEGGMQYWLGFSIIHFAPGAVELLDDLIAQFS